MQKFHKTKAHDEMTEIFRCHKFPVKKKLFFVQLFFGIVNKIIIAPCV